MGPPSVRKRRDESVGGSLNFPHVVTVSLVVVAPVVAHRLVSDGPIAEMGLAPLLPGANDADNAAPDRWGYRGKTTRERVEARGQE